MLELHDGIDVFKPEELLKWQIKAMELVAGQQPTAKYNLGFKDIKVTGQQRRELLALREEGETAALSVDV